MGVKIDMSDLEIGGDAKILNDAKISSKSEVDINVENVNVKGKAEVLNELNTGKGSKVKVKIKDTTIDGNARTLNDVDVADGKLQVEVENFKTGNDVEFMNDKKISKDTVIKVEKADDKKSGDDPLKKVKNESEFKAIGDRQDQLDNTEVDLISALSINVEKLEENKDNRIQEMIKEQKLDIGKAHLNKIKEEALLEIRKHDYTEIEAKSDLEKIEKELEKVEEAESNIEKKVTNEIISAKRTLTEAKRLTGEKTTIEKDIKNEQETIQKLEKAKEEALVEMRKHDYTEIEAKVDLEKIEKELTEKNNKLLAQKIKIEKIDKQLEKISSKNVLEKYETKSSKLNENRENRQNQAKQVRQDLDARTERTIAKNKTAQQLSNNTPNPNQAQQSSNTVIQQVRQDLDARTEMAIAKNKTVQQLSNNTPNPNQTQQSSNNTPKPNIQPQDIGKIVGIEIVEGSDEINIARIGEDGQIQNEKIENQLQEILKNKRAIFKNPQVAKVIDEIEPSRFKQIFLKRKLSPVILDVLSQDKKDGLSMINYVVAIKREENCENLKIKHDLSNTVLKGRLKRMMKRVAKTEHYIDGMEVRGLKETKTMGLLESGKRKLKNKPVTIKEGFKLVGKPFKAIGKGINAIGKETKNKFRKNIEVEKSIKDKLKAVSKSFEDEDLEKLEDKEDPDLEETEPKTQEDEEQEIE